MREKRKNIFVVRPKDFKMPLLFSSTLENAQSIQDVLKDDKIESVLMSLDLVTLETTELE